MISSKLSSRLQLWTMSFTPGFPSNKYLLMGWGGSVDVQHSLLYVSEPFLAFLALFGLGQGHFFVAEGPAVSGSVCGGFLRFSFISDKNSSSYDTSVASIISLKSESLKSKRLSSVSNVNPFRSWSFCLHALLWWYHFGIENQQSLYHQKTRLNTITSGWNFLERWNRA